LSLSTALIVGLTGCGGGSDGGDNASATGTGFYIDSAVNGVDYTCGTQKGVTDKDGKFTFDKGKGCRFFLAGVALRETSAEKLSDNVKVLEDSIEVARFLQSLDNDGNASNGIEITAAVKAALTVALEGAGSSGEVPTGNAVDNVVTAIETKVSEFKGEAKTIEQAKEHLSTTQTEVTKALLAGKTFYQLGNDSEDTWLSTFVFNADVTSVNVKDQEKVDSEDFSININGKKLTPSGDDINDGFYTVFVEQTSDYLLFEDYVGDSKKGESKFYFNQAKAQAAYDAVKTFGTYAENGTSITISKADAGMNKATPPNFGFNISHYNGESKVMLQIQTTYGSKKAFESAFTGNTLDLSSANENIIWVGMDIRTDSTSNIKDGNQSEDFKVTVTKNGDGTYNLASMGSLTIDDSAISSIDITKIRFVVYN